METDPRVVPAEMTGALTNPAMAQYKAIVEETSSRAEAALRERARA